MRISDWSSDVCSSDLIVREEAVADARVQRITADLLDVFGFTIGAEDVPVDRVGDAAAEAEAIIEIIGRIFADTRTDLGRAAEQRAGDRLIARVARCQRRIGGVCAIEYGRAHV